MGPGQSRLPDAAGVTPVLEACCGAPCHNGKVPAVVLHVRAIAVANIMGDNIPSSSRAAPGLRPCRRSGRRADESRLPTPPPDPTSGPRPEDDFLVYLESLRGSNLCYSRSSSCFAPILASDDAFDHLEKLYRLMEQMLELREQNAKLHRRIRDLEHWHNLEKMHHELKEGALEEAHPELDKDTAFAETILESILADAKSFKPKWPSHKLRQSIYKRHRHHRSGSILDKSITLDPDSTKDDRRASSYVVDNGAKKTKVSKWTKVKAAFKWEKASPTVNEAKSQDSGVGGLVPVNLEVARYLRVPSTSDEAGHSPADSGAAGISTPGTISTASSTEEFQQNAELKTHCDELKSSDDEHSHTNYIPHLKDVYQKCTKFHQRTPWAKMKDIINTKSSVKRKHRLSAQSDDIQIDVELCSDNEDVFEDEKMKLSKTPSPIMCQNIYVPDDTKEIPERVRERYRQVLNDGGSVVECNEPRRISKWTRVRKAFLSPHELNQDSVINQDQSKINDESRKIRAEIKRNYKQLQKKLSLEFQEKLFEWERMKQNSPNAISPSPFSDDGGESSFTKKFEEWEKMKNKPLFGQKNVPMNEENLAPEFRKRLQEWEKIKKTSTKESGAKRKIGEMPRWKSMSSQKSDPSPVFEYPQITDEFKKKLDEWKVIKSGGISSGLEERNNKSPSPRLLKTDLSPKHSKKYPKEAQNKELQWLEKELNKIEKEKQRLERERQKFLDREEKLSKLRNSVIGDLKKEVLIHTPSGFYRFEGISRKFTQKLYEWEKAQGIAPESSTFALLKSYFNLNLKSTPLGTIGNPSALMRSKSVDSIAISALNLTCPLMSHQPSSLSLNNVEDLEKECMTDSKYSSIIHSHDTLPIEEPEALIVEIEDIVEETAAPLETFTEKFQQPFYQKEQKKIMCEGETCDAPQIQKSESEKAQNNYNLIEEIIIFLQKFNEVELEIQKTQEQNDRNIDHTKLKLLNDAQHLTAKLLSEKIYTLQDANLKIITNFTKNDEKFCHIIDILQAFQDISSEIIILVEALIKEIKDRNVFELCELGATSCPPAVLIVKDIHVKILELRRHLSYVCAATDLTASKKNRFNHKKKKSNLSASENEERKLKEKRLYIKSETSNVESQGAIKKRIRYRQRTAQVNAKDTDDENEEETIMEVKRNKPKKPLRNRSISECNRNGIKQQSSEETIIANEDIVQNLVVPTETTLVVNVKQEESLKIAEGVSVFVQTIKKRFDPFVEDKSQRNQNEFNKSKTTEKPPLPVSPNPQKKLMKEISPNIRIMMAKYNQKISEKDISKSGGSSGSGSPLAWRSPTAERRVKATTVKYEKGLNKMLPLLGQGKELRKSTSIGQMTTIHKPNLSPPQNEQGNYSILKAASAIAIYPKDMSSYVKSGEYAVKHSPEIRKQKLQKAKEEFLKLTPAPALESAPASTAVPFRIEENVKFPERNRLSQISVESDTSCDSTFPVILMKSASAGMINIDEESYKKISPEIHREGYVSLPRTYKKNVSNFLGGKFTISNITSKFRKVKMRKGKDRENKLTTVSALCRQSLVVDICANNSAETKTNSSENISSSVTSSSKDKSWLKRPKIFKK